MTKRSKPHGRRTLAAPFVLTLVSCGGSEGGPTEPTSTPTDIVNPPPVLTAPTAAPTQTPTAAPTTTAARPEAVTPTSWTITNENGKCRAMEASQCPPGDRCNPPPPQSYPCIDAQKIYPAVVTRDADGRCTTRVRSETGHCPPRALCNPPPPREVEVPCPK